MLGFVACGRYGVNGETLDLTTRRMQVGYVSCLTLLSAEQTYPQSLINLVQVQPNRYADTAALFQAPGGGWWNRPDVPKNYRAPSNPPTL